MGMGSIGSAFAFQLAHVGGHRVTAVARPGSLRFEQLKQHGGVINTQQEQVRLEVVDRLDIAAPYDLIIVTLLAHQVSAVLPALQTSAARALLFMFNNFEPEQLSEVLGSDRCSFGMPFIQAHLDRAGSLTAKIGAGGQKSKISNQTWVALFNAAGLPAVFEPNMFAWLRCHAPLGAAFESVSVAAMRRGGGASWREAMVIARGAQETFTLIQELGGEIYPRGKSLLHTSPTFVLASLLWSMSKIRSFRELLATGANECRALVDAFLASASRHTVPVSQEAIMAMKPTED